MPPEVFTLDDDEANATADSVAARMPDPSTHFNPGADDGSPAPQTAPNPTTTIAEMDNFGTLWNPEIHATGADGKGVKTQKGEWRKKRKSKLVDPRAPTPEPQAQAATPAQDPKAPPVLTEAQKNEARAAGVVVAQCIFLSSRALGGEEWEPSSDERSMMNDAWGNYFIAKGVTNIPPGLMVVVACGAYAAPRFAMPKTRSRLQRAKEWAAAKYAKWKVRGKQKQEGRTADEATEAALS